MYIYITILAILTNFVYLKELFQYYLYEDSCFIKIYKHLIICLNNIYIKS